MQQLWEAVDAHAYFNKFSSWAVHSRNPLDCNLQLPYARKTLSQHHSFALLHCWEQNHIATDRSALVAWICLKKVCFHHFRPNLDLQAALQLESCEISNYAFDFGTENFEIWVRDQKFSLHRLNYQNKGLSLYFILDRTCPSVGALDVRVWQLLADENVL